MGNRNTFQRWTVHNVLQYMQEYKILTEYFKTQDCRFIFPTSERSYWKVIGFCMFVFDELKKKKKTISSYLTKYVSAYLNAGLQILLTFVELSTWHHFSTCCNSLFVSDFLLRLSSVKSVQSSVVNQEAAQLKQILM